VENYLEKAVNKSLVRLWQYGESFPICDEEISGKNGSLDGLSKPPVNGSPRGQVGCQAHHYTDSLGGVTKGPETIPPAKRISKCVCHSKYPIKSYNYKRTLQLNRMKTTTYQ
jgi:hypothetical protein